MTACQSSNLSCKFSLARQGVTQSLTLCTFKLVVLLFNMLLPFFLFSNRQNEASFTSNFARLLEAKSGELPLKEMVKRAARASFDEHRLSSNLFDPK